MSKTFLTGLEDNPIEVEVPDSHNEVFADGMSGVAVGPAHTKIMLTSVNPTAQPRKEGEPERRRAVCTLVMPTNALIEVCNIILTNATNVKDELEKAIHNQADLLSRLIPEAVENPVKNKD